MARNAIVIDNRIVMIGKKNTRKRLLKKLKKLVRYNAIINYRLRKKYKMFVGAMQIEFTSCCNLRCRMCPNSIDTDMRGRGYMDVDLFKKKIIDYIVDNPQYYFDLINLWQGGEALLHPRFGELMEIIGKAKKDTKNFPRVNFLTNGMLLDRQMAQIILDSGAVDEFDFSIDWGNKEEFENARRGAKWETVLENAKNLVNMNNEREKKVTTGIFSIISLDRHKNFSPEFLDIVQKIDYFHPRPAHDWDGNYNLELVNKSSCNNAPKKGLCGRIENTLAILWNGLVVPCCNDLTGRGIIGDLNKETLFEIFNGRTRMLYIDLMRKGQRQRIELCKNCSL